MARKRRGSAKGGKLSVLRLLHLLPGVGVALAGDTGSGGSLGGAWGAWMQNQSNPQAAFGAASQEFMNDLMIAYTGYKPSDGSTFYAKGYPFRTYGFHFAIELTRWLIKKFVKRTFNMGPLKFP